MKSICSIILLISTLGSYAADIEAKAIVWYDGSSHYKALDSKRDATVYFKEWESAVSQYLADPDYKVALHLDRSLDPLPTDKALLPGLADLAATNDDSLIGAYFSFLEDYSRTMGFDYLVLPDTVGYTSYEKEVIASANLISPYFFISPGHLSKDLPTSKEEAEQMHPAIWIIDQTADDLRIVSKWNKRIVKEYHKDFQLGFLKEEDKPFKRTLSLPKALSEAIFFQGSTLIDPEERLPIREKAVVYLGEDEALRQRLSQYVQVYLRPQPIKMPVILDRRTGERRKSFGNEIIIDLIGAGADEGVATLLTPGRISNDDIYIAKMLFGAMDIEGRIALEGNRSMKSMGFMAYSEPEVEGLDPEKLRSFETIIEESISEYAIPGCQVVVAKNGAIVWEKAYGYFTYDSLAPLTSHTLFDIASVTKVAGTLPAVARLLDEGRINLDDSISQYLPAFAGSNKSSVTIRELLAHNSGVRSYIPFWRWALDGDRLNAFYYKTQEDEANDIRSYGLEPDPALRDSLKRWIVQSDLMDNPEEYNYSDIGFMMLHLLVEEVSGMPLDQFVAQEFYDPMKLDLTFNPMEHGISYEEIAPTEYDDLYRSGQIWGKVHDRNAHIFGGVAGHAGLFATASDLAKLMQLFLNEGYYGGTQYLTSETVSLLNQRYYTDNRRGLGWDKKDGDKDSASPKASDASFGHTGFTGTMVWADPEADLVYIFLSNRIYPSVLNTKLMEMDTRTNIHDVIYDAFLPD